MQINFIYIFSRWFHKPCTKLMKFTEKFSCRSVKMKCLEAPPLPVKPPAPPKEPVIKRAVVKFKADYPRLMMKNVHHRWNLQFWCIQNILLSSWNATKVISIFLLFLLTFFFTVFTYVMSVSIIIRGKFTESGLKLKYTLKNFIWFKR